MGTSIDDDFGVAIRDALARRELFLEFQPQWSLSGGRVRGFEALLRWQRGCGQIVPPSRFIPELESNGGIVSVGQWVANEAVSVLAGWGLDTPVMLSINASARQLASTELVETITSMVEQGRISPSKIEVEITETALLPDLPCVLERLNEIKRLGVRLALDDFGVGYSSISHLHRYPIDTLKIDRSLISSIRDSERARLIVKALVTLGRQLNMEVVGEGIETCEELAFLRDIGCDVAQGFLLGRPVAEWSTSGLRNIASRVFHDEMGRDALGVDAPEDFGGQVGRQGLRDVVFDEWVVHRPSSVDRTFGA